MSDGQNLNNHISSRSSTRLHAPPGGRSSISFGDDTPTAAAVSGNAYASKGGESQNVGNFMTGHSSTKVYVGNQTRSQISFGDDSSSMFEAKKASAPMQPSDMNVAQQRPSGSNAYASKGGESQNVGNFLVDGRPTSRVLKPPGGGASQITFG